MDLSGKKNKGEKTSKKDKPVRAKKQKPVREKKRRSRRDEVIEEHLAASAIDETGEDEVVTPESDVSDVEQEVDNRPTKMAVAIVPPFEGGLVHRALAMAVNAQWGRTEEANIFVDCMKTVHMVDGAYVGDIVVRPSFVKRSKGSALL